MARCGGRVGCPWNAASTCDQRCHANSSRQEHIRTRGRTTKSSTGDFEPRPVYISAHDHRDRSTTAAPSGKGAPARTTTILRKPDWIRVKAPVSKEYAATREIVRAQQAAHGVRGGGLPQYRRVLDQAPRHHDDHGRHLHPRLRLLQCQDRPARRAGCRRAGQCRARGEDAGPDACGDHLGGPRRSGRWRGGSISPT